MSLRPAVSPPFTTLLTEGGIIPSSLKVGIEVLGASFPIEGISGISSGF
jgi:hypothetical protein